MARLSKDELAQLHQERIRIIWMEAGGNPEVAIPRIAEYVMERIGKIIRKERTRNKGEPQQRWAEAKYGEGDKAA